MNISYAIFLTPIHDTSIARLATKAKKCSSTCEQYENSMELVLQVQTFV
jgi:hypothetical protein